MSTRVVERVDEWPDEPFSDGYHQLHDLADEGFSGVVRAGGVELYMTKGTVVGVLGGGVEAFEDATGTVREAPSAALPLLAVMQERNDEVRAKYYTEKTPISEVDSTLSDGGFTGYVELSENVLSGDYYLVYHGGQSMSVAYVGNRPELLDGQEAFDRADGEVGIYKVKPAPVDAVEIPEPTGPPADTPPADEEPADPAPDTDEEVADTGSTAETAPEEEASTSPDYSVTPDESGGTDAGAETETTEKQPEQPSPSANDGADTTSQRTADRSQQAEPGGGTTGTASEQTVNADQRTGGGETRARQREQGTAGGQPRTQSTDASGTSQRDVPTPQQGRQRQSSNRGTSGSSGTTTGLETRAIPSLDPEQTKESDDNGARGDSPGTREAGRTEAKRADRGQSETKTAQQSAGQPRQQADQQTTEPERQQTAQQSGQRPAGGQQQEPATDDASTEAIEELETELEERESEIERLEDELETATGERDELEAELESVRSERDDLQTEVDRLQEELERLETEFGAATDAERRLTSSEALDGTDLFVRYHSKGDATLEKAHAGGVRREDVTDNLRLEKHTQFDAASVAIGDREYSEFLESTAEFQFVRWLIRDLLFEIRETSHTKGLQDIYDALPQVDRAELSGAVDVIYSDDGQETRSTERFDVVLRDRMGNPLLVANLNDSREAATQSMMEDLITAAERVGQTADGFSGAFLVTQSFFEPGALETASEATKDGLLSRDKRKSFVNLSRKSGYHLCLVEARNEDHHLAVPEL